MYKRQPLTEYREEAYLAFKHLTQSMYEDYLRTLLRLQLAVPEDEEEVLPQAASPLQGKVQYSSPEAALTGDDEKPSRASSTVVKDQDDPYANVGRNDMCPCGSGLKYKKCHGKDAQE